MLFMIAGSIFQLYQPIAIERCQNPPTRREWRSLTMGEKIEFTTAVNTLARIPSRWRNNGTLYDDFAILHGGVGSWCEFFN